MPRQQRCTKVEPRRSGGRFAAHDPFRVRYARNELVCHEGSYAAGVYIIESGLVSESNLDPRGATAKPYAILGPGELIGLEILVPGDNELHRTSCRALVDTELSFLERDRFLSALEIDDPLRRFVLESISRRLFALAASVRRGSVPPDERLCALLLDLTVTHGRTSARGDAVLPPPINRRLISELAGLSASQFRRAWDTLPTLEGASEREGIRLSPQALSAWLEESRRL